MTQTFSPDVLICGAGIAGIAAAHALATQHGVRVLVVDERPPLTLTSDKSTEAYRNWWPGPDDAMVRLMNRSIDLLEQWSAASDDRFLLNRRGYVYATARPEAADRLVADAEQASAQGAGSVRRYESLASTSTYQPSAHRGFVGHPDGADVFLDAAAIRRHFPFLAPNVRAVVHARRCGWMSGQQLGMHLLDEAKRGSAELLSGRVRSIETRGGAICGAIVQDEGGREVRVETSAVVDAAGPFAADVAQLAGVRLPLFSELHLKLAFEDTMGVIDRNTGLVILDDPQSLSWGDDVRDELAADESTRWMTETMPAGIHLRPEGYGANQTVLMLWDYHSTHRYDVPELPLPEDPYYPEVVMRGMVALAPGLAPYVERLPRMYTDGGYYTKTEENRPLVGPTPVPGFYVNCAFSGYGLMAAPAAGELLAAHIVGTALPSHSAAFTLDRYERADYRARLAAWGSTGQL